MSWVIDTDKYGNPACQAGASPPSNYPSSFHYCVSKFFPFQLTVNDSEVFQGKIRLGISHSSFSNKTYINFSHHTIQPGVIATATLIPFYRGWFDIYRPSGEKIGRGYWSGFTNDISLSFGDDVLLTMHYESTDSSSSSSSSDITSESMSSEVVAPSGVSYYSDLKSHTSIANPILGKQAQMQYSGFLKEDWTKEDVDFDNFGYGLRKTKNNKGFIYCKDASSLFSLAQGYIEIVISLPHAITNGVYEPLKNDNLDISEYLLWGVNVGQHEIGQPGLYASLTPRGIEFTIFTAESKFTIVNTVTNAEANSNILFQFFWGDDLYYVGGTSAFMVNGENVQLGNAPISEDSIEDLNFCALDTPYCYSNLECVIKRLATYFDIPDFIRDEWDSSSSSSSSSSSMPFVADVWVTNTSDNSLTWWNVYEINRYRTDFVTADKPAGIAKDLNGNIWVANGWSNSISIFDASNNYSRTDYGAGIGNSPQELAIDLNNNIWVTNYIESGPGSVSMFDASNLYNRTEYVVPDTAWKIAIDSNNDVWIVYDGYGYFISRLDSSASYARTDFATLHTYSNSVAIDSKNNVWIITGSTTVSKFDASASYVRTDYSTAGNDAYGIAVDSKDNIWITYIIGTVRVSMYDALNFYSRTDYSFSAVGQIFGLALDSNDNVWFTNWYYTGHRLIMLDAESGYIDYQEFPAGNYAAHLAINFLVKH